MHVVRGEMLKQTSSMYCAIIKDVKIQKYIFWFSLWRYFTNNLLGLVALCQKNQLGGGKWGPSYFNPCTPVHDTQS